MTLVIMAAGMGSRFGGLKQIEPVGPHGEIIIDYSIYDAILAGFTKVVFIIKEENYELFKQIIGDKVSKKIEVEYVFQKNDNIFDITGVKIEREKPFGTAHAILCAKEKVHENFAVINADDFYGRDAFVQIANFLKKTTGNYGLIGYHICNTITASGAVKRGVCEAENGKVKHLVECSVDNKTGKYIASPLSGAEPFEISPDHLVSMNMMGFTPKLFDFLEERLKTFVVENKDNLDKCEYLIPEVLCDQIKTGTVEVDLLDTSSVWYGITYKDDKVLVENALKQMTDEGIYPEEF